MDRRRSIAACIPAFALLASPAPIVRAADSDTWDLCPTPVPITAFSTDPETVAPGATDLQADDASAEDDSGRARLAGNVEITKNDLQFGADRVVFDQATGDGTLAGNVQFRGPGIELTADGGEVNTVKETADFRDVEFRLIERHGRGNAAGVRRTAERITLLDDTTYTTCPAGRTDWLLSAGDLELDHPAGTGTATNVLVRFYGVPLIYTPWLSFPITDERKSGFLAPGVGSSGNAGTEIAIPWYWNIHPQADATVTPRDFSKRGARLDTEFRWLTGSTEGTLDLEYLPEDRMTGEERGYGEYTQTSLLPLDWRVDVDLEYATDSDYFFDFGSDQAGTNRFTLPRSVDVSQAGDSYEFRIRFRDDQIINDALPATRIPYQTLPRMTFDQSLELFDTGLSWQLEAEATRFDDPDRVTGDRFHFQPGFAWRFETPGYFVEPAVELWHTRYELDRPAGDTGPTGISRTAPVTSLDAGLFLERDASAGGAVIQTLEPRIRYLHVPFRDQENLPLFDTRTADTTFSRLFANNRFTGPDRLGDTEQVAISLTSRYLDTRSGNSLFKGTLGQILYFDDRRVTLAGAPDESGYDRSDLLAELEWSPVKELTARAGLQWDPQTDRTDQSSVHLGYTPDARSAVSIGYRRRADRLEQAEAGFAWPVADSLRLVGKWTYAFEESGRADVPEDRLVNQIAGLEYETCCWALRLVRREYVAWRPNAASQDLNENETYFLELTLKGLTSVGRKTEELLGSEIQGYTPSY